MSERKIKYIDDIGSGVDYQLDHRMVSMVYEAYKAKMKGQQVVFSLPRHRSAFNRVWKQLMEERADDNI